jgi:hypothetical protein
MSIKESEDSHMPETGVQDENNSSGWLGPFSTGRISSSLIASAIAMPTQ